MPNPSSQGKDRKPLPSSSNRPNAAVGILLGLASAYFSMAPRKKAMFYLVWVAALSVLANLYTFDVEHSYFTQKHNILNQYGVKIGWFWTLFVAAPFVWFVGKACHKETERIFKDMTRLLVATLLWYLTVNMFHRILQVTSYCNKSASLPRAVCAAQGGHWILGLDISGHCFLMVYSMLILNEESSALRAFLRASREHPEKTKEVQFTVHLFYLLMFSLHIFWDLQMIISTLYYHTMFDKVAGVATAVGCWVLTYRIAYKQGGFLPLPLTVDPKETPKAGKTKFT